VSWHPTIVRRALLAELAAGVGLELLVEVGAESVLHTGFGTALGLELAAGLAIGLLFGLRR